MKEFRGFRYIYESKSQRRLQIFVRLFYQNDAKLLKFEYNDFGVPALLCIRSVREDGDVDISYLITPDSASQTP